MAKVVGKSFEGYIVDNLSSHELQPRLETLLIGIANKIKVKDKTLEIKRKNEGFCLEILNGKDLNDYDLIMLGYIKTEPNKSISLSIYYNKINVISIEKYLKSKFNVTNLKIKEIYQAHE